ncbi:cytochrome b [Pseudaquidulcibacter saccharophilus]|uniref:cytochrome b n=1 Tax=Pseudaquidulcibacter saccharophilus TaxID=2831900 RepID=UPI001EFF4144|nr:cytochrome b N-terminal domain-containing protein [Pseudaquidulcibacter saccharophilus]
MSGPSKYVPQSGFEKWIDKRLPLVRFAYDTMIDFPTPKNLNYWWTFGAVLAIFLGIQIVTGIVLVMHYIPATDRAFMSIAHIMRDVNYGWLIRYMHMSGASFFFLAVYLHIFRGLYYGSYKEPREVLWGLGVIIYLLMVMTAFMGYVLPWGQMSFWGATVITNLTSAIPFVGESIHNWLLGGFAVDQPTLNRFLSLHYLLPFVILGVVVLHIWALHVPGNNNPTGVEVKDVEKETLPFHPYYTIKDAFAILVFLMVYFAFVFFAPEALNHPDNYIPANNQVTPAHIVPEWYLLPFYAILRAVDFDIIPGIFTAKLGGVIAMLGAILVWLALPVLDSSKIKSMRYRPLARIFWFIWIANFIFLGICGAMPAQAPWTWLSKIGLVYYFLYFLVILPVLSKIEKPKTPPASIADSIADAPKGEEPNPNIVGVVQN